MYNYDLGIFEMKMFTKYQLYGKLTTCTNVYENQENGVVRTQLRAEEYLLEKGTNSQLHYRKNDHWVDRGRDGGML